MGHTVHNIYTVQYCNVSVYQALFIILILKVIIVAGGKVGGAEGDPS